MSTGHRAEGVREKTRAELDKVLGEGDTPQLMAQAFTVDHTHDIAYAGGVSVDRRTSTSTSGSGTRYIPARWWCAACPRAR